MKQLDNLNYVARWTTHMGCIKSCLDYLGVNISEAWLYGGTGHAFVINIHPELCPSGPTAWNSVMLFELASNLGYQITGEYAQKTAPDFAEKQRRAFEHIKQAIDNNQPCYGWEMEVPEYYVIYGYDDTGYYYKGAMAEDGKGPKPWQEIGMTGIGFYDMYTITRTEPADDATTVKAALEAALKHASGTSDWIFENYYSGVAGFDAWITALETCKADHGGLGYNVAVWAECRRVAPGFLKEAQMRLNGDTKTLFDEAIKQYQVVADNLNSVEKLYPFDMGGFGQPITDSDANRAAITALRTARDAEARGLETLGKIVAAL